MNFIYNALQMGDFEHSIISKTLQIYVTERLIILPGTICVRQHWIAFYSVVGATAEFLDEVSLALSVSGMGGFGFLCFFVSVRSS